MEQNNSESCYNLLFPCIVSEDKAKASECKINLSITKINCQLIILFSDNINNTINMKDFTTMYIDQSALVVNFVQDNGSKTLILFFFNSPNNFKRFLFTIAESGLIVPESLYARNKFSFLPFPSFFPSYNFSYGNTHLFNQIISIINKKVMQISESNLPFNKSFVDRIVNFFYQYYKFKIDKWSGVQGSRYSAASFIKLLFKLHKVNHEFTYSIKKKKVQTDFVNLIKSDERNFRDYNKNWTQELSQLCFDVCSLYASKSNYYAEGNFLIARNLSLVMKIVINEQKLPNLVKVLKQHFSDCLYGFYSSIISIFPFKSKDEMEKFEKEITEQSKTLFKNEFPSVFSYFKMHNAQSRQWIHPKCGTLFADASDEPWKLWSFVLQSSDAASAFACFIASVVFHTIPKRTSKTTSQFGGTSFSREDMDEYVNTAEYILTNQ